MEDEINKIVLKLGLSPLIEGHFIKEENCSDISIETLSGNLRPLYNWAYYLIPEGKIFPLHKLRSDESWQFCLGGPLDLYLINNGEIQTIRIGPDIFNDESLFHIIKRNTWFGAKASPGTKYTLITHCVCPGWHSDDDLPGYYEEMIEICPEYPKFIKEFSWPKSLPKI